MLVPGGALTFLRAITRRQPTRTHRQQATLNAARAAWPIPLQKARTKYECQYCCERKSARHFAKAALVPHYCQPHFTKSNGVCASCLEASISVQLDIRGLLDVRCPECNRAWTLEDVKVLAGKKDAKRLRELDKMIKKGLFVPFDPPDDLTMDELLARGARLCPKCFFPFVKTGGCDTMTCEVSAI